MKETDLAKSVIAWLRDLKWEIYQEVQVFSYGPVADIVAVLGSVIWVIETKSSLNLDVMRQANNWRPFSNFVSVAVPVLKFRDGAFRYHILDLLGVGLLRVRRNEYFKEVEVDELIRPVLNRHTGSRLKESLREVHKTFAEAGNAEKIRWSPFQQTCSGVKKYVDAHPGATLKEVIDNVKTHYHSTDTARSCISKWAEEGAIRGVKKVRDGKVCRFYPEERGGE